MTFDEALAEVREWAEIFAAESVNPRDAIPIRLRDIGRMFKDRLAPDGDLGRALTPKVIAKGNAMPEREYRTKTTYQFVGGPRDGQWETYPVGQYDRQIRIYLDRAPKGSQPVLIIEAP